MTEIRYLGVAAFEITNRNGYRLIIDPYLDDNPFSTVKSDQLDKIDLILVTHAAYDHLGDTAKIAKKFKTPVICGADVKAYLIKQGVLPEKLIGIIWGLTLEYKGIIIKSVESRHWSSMITPEGAFYSGPAMGFIVCPDPEVRIYHCGDTKLFSDLKLIGQLDKPNIGLLNVSDPDIGTAALGCQTMLVTGEMTPYEAALASQWLHLEYAIPIHFGTLNKDVQAFIKILNSMADSGFYVKPIVLKPGEVFKYDGKENETRSSET